MLKKITFLLMMLVLNGLSNENPYIIKGYEVSFEDLPPITRKYGFTSGKSAKFALKRIALKYDNKTFVCIFDSKDMHLTVEDTSSRTHLKSPSYHKLYKDLFDPQLFIIKQEDPLLIFTYNRVEHEGGKPDGKLILHNKSLDIYSAKNYEYVSSRSFNYYGETLITDTTQPYLNCDKNNPPLLFALMKESSEKFLTLVVIIKKSVYNEDAEKIGTKYVSLFWPLMAYRHDFIKTDFENKIFNGDVELYYLQR